MDVEDDLFRPPPQRPYAPGQATLELPRMALAETLRLLQRAGRLESGLFWYGPRDETGNGRVAYVVAPRQRMSWGNYSISTESLTEIVYQLPDGWKPLAQVHSHPGDRVEHSNYDDRMASTHKALSLVFPFYGHARGEFPAGIGIHECQNDYWHLLEDHVAQRRVVLCEGTVQVDDFR